MLAGQVEIDEVGQLDALHLLDRLVDPASSCFAHQICLGLEVLVKPAMGEAGGSHEVCNTDAVIAALAKQPGRRFHDMRSVSLCLGLCDLHFAALSAIKPTNSIH
ncbi:hypothetical protein D3C81_1235970 [compost metagenome]